MDLSDKVAIITGGAAGIGLCIAKSLLEQGVSVALLDLDKEKGEDSKKQLQEKYGMGKVDFFTCNVTIKEEFQGAVKEAVNKYSRLDIFINNAGIGTHTQWEYIIEVNLIGVMRGAEEATKYMSKEFGGNGGVIVNIASIAGLVPLPLGATYSASKHGVIGFTRSLGSPETFETSGVRHVAICPGFTDTELVKGSKDVSKEDIRKSLKRKVIFQKPEVVATCVVEAVKNAATGSVWVVAEDEPGYEISIPSYKTFKVTSD